MEKLEGIVENVIFSSDDGRFTVFRIKPNEQHSRVTATVPLPAPLVGQQLSLNGEWVDHPRFGLQFKAQHMTVVAPTSLEGIERFLCSGTIEGVGPAMAKRLIAKFGGATLEIIEKAPDRLREVSGIGPKKARQIHASYMEQAELRDIMLWMEKHNVSGAFAGRIYEKYGSFAIRVMEENPYRLVREVEGIGFNTAETIAANIGFSSDDDCRIEAGIDNVLERAGLNGNCCVPEGWLVDKTSQMLHVDEELVWPVLKQNLSAGILEQESRGDQLMVYSQGLYNAEVQTAQILLDLKKNAEPLRIDDADQLVRDWEQDNSIELASMQREAVRGALENGIFVLTGGPGTGKTTVIKGMLDLLEMQGLQILLGAPTGRAAKRLSEATGRKASTIHRMLEAQGVDDAGSIFGRGSDEQLEADAIILDEVSMMDIVLMSHFLEAVPEGCHVILVGDADQLPAVGPGSVLKDILLSKAIPQVRLTEVFRQSGESSIVMNAHAINAGRLPEFNASNDFYFFDDDDPNIVEEMIVEFCKISLPQWGYSNLEDVQVLSPMHRYSCGVESLNKKLQAALNPPKPYKPEAASASRVFRLGDKVMQTKNNYTKGVFNGDIGFIQEITPELVIVRYNDEMDVEYERQELLELQLAYAMSVHKSQGSEYPVVILPLVPGHRPMLQRNLLYTAVTRAQKLVILLGSRAAVNTAVMNNKTGRRCTLLAERLSGSLYRG